MLKRTLYAILILIIPGCLFAEAIFLTNGNIVQGTITGDTPREMTIQLKDGKTQTIPRKDVLRVLYTNLKMNKIYIQMRDGSSLEAYVVDEDQNTITYRRELYKNEEYTINRMDLLFITEKNPSGLRGEPTTESVNLTWFPPYNEVKEYRIYSRRSQSEEYELIETTDVDEALIKGLTSNTIYYFIVKSVDLDDYESGPSNELKVQTENIKPEMAELAVTIGDKGAFNMTWEPATDEDGTISEYRIYYEGDEGPVLAGTTRKNNYTFNQEGVREVSVRAVDDRGGESEKVSFMKKHGISLTGSFWYFSPLGDLGKMIDPGYGGMVEFSIENFFFDNFSAGISAGYTLFGTGEANERMNDASMGLFLLKASYSFDVFNGLYITPCLYGGYSYFSIEYTLASDNSTVSKNAFEPIALYGIQLGYNFTDVNLQLGFSYGNIFESDGPLSLWSINFGFGWHF